jgi:hypothetical protein
MVRDNLSATDVSAIEQAIATLVRSTLTAQERVLLAAIDAISDLKVRDSLVALACAAAGFDLQPPRRDDDGPEDPPLGVHRVDASEICIRRVRRHLRARVGKGGVDQ